MPRGIFEEGTKIIVTPKIGPDRHLTVKHHYLKNGIETIILEQNRFRLQKIDGVWQLQEWNRSPIPVKVSECHELDEFD